MSAPNSALKHESSEGDEHPTHSADVAFPTDSVRIRGGAGSVLRRAQPPRDMVANVRQALHHNGNGGGSEANAAAAALPFSAAAAASFSGGFTVPAGFSSFPTLSDSAADPAPTLSAAAAAAASASASTSSLPQLPPKCSWFLLTHIHPTEIAALPEFFMEPPTHSATSPNQAPPASAAVGVALPRRSADLHYNPFRTPQVYKDYRDWMFLTYHSDPAVYLHVTTCLKFLVADFGTVARIHRALEGWELINLPSKVALDTKPSFLPVALPEAANS